MFFREDYYLDNGITEAQEKLLMDYAQLHIEYLIARDEVFTTKKKNRHENMKEALKKMNDFMPQIRNIPVSKIESNVYLLVAASLKQRIDILDIYMEQKKEINEAYRKWFSLKRDLKDEYSIYLNLKKQKERELQLLFNELEKMLKKWVKEYYLSKDGLVLRDNNRIGAWFYTDVFTEAQKRYLYQLDYAEYRNNVLKEHEIVPEFSKIYMMEALEQLASLYKNSKAVIEITEKSDLKIEAKINDTLCIFSRGENKSIKIVCPEYNLSNKTQGNIKNAGIRRLWYWYSVYINNIYTNHIKSEYMYLETNKKRTISEADIIVKSAIKCCEYKLHTVDDVIAKFQVRKKDNQIVWEYIHAAYCHECNRYYVLTEDFSKIDGIPLCKVCEIVCGVLRDYSQINEKERLDYESLIHSYGYNVNINENLSKEDRQSILVNLINDKVVSQEIILSYLDHLILRGTGSKRYEQAVRKWKEDRIYIEKLWYETDVVIPGSVININTSTVRQ